jgi:sulfite reductase (ferredoxin)
MGSRKEHKNEGVKRERDGLDCLDDIVRYAREGFHSISEEDLNVRLRWFGLYTQRPQEDGFFMLRVKIPNGIVTAEQLDAMGRISLRYGRNTGDITTRQGVQFHYIRIEDVPAIFAALEAVGLTTSGACGDITRNVTGDALAGIDARELIDARPTVEAIHRFFLDNREFSNLPRKFKIAVSGAAHHATNHQINDIGLAAVRRADGRVAFDLWVGGGLGSKERFADRLGAHVFPDEAPEVCAHICAIFRDHGNRESRHRARLKFLLEEWGPQRFREELERRLGRALTDGERARMTDEASQPHVGVHPQKEAGLYYVGAATRCGRFDGERMTATAKIAKAFGSGEIRLTPAQNLVILNVPDALCERAAAALEALDFQVRATPFQSGTLACTGRQFCKLAVVETKSRAAEIIEHLESALPNFGESLRISVTGCPNSCAHYQVCDIGLVGDAVTTPDGKREAFRIFLGGSLGDDHAFGRELGRKIPADEAKFYIERLAREFLARRREGERFGAYLRRHSDAELVGLGGLEAGR